MASRGSEPDQREAVIEHYAQLAANYDRRWDRYTRRTLAEVMTRLDLDRDDRLLDVACGTGRLAAMIRESGHDTAILGIDLSPDMIAVARQRFTGDDRASWRVASADALPVEDHSHDVVVCANAFHLIPDQLAALREFRRALRPGGRLVVMDWCREYLTMALLQRASQIFDRQHRRILRRDELCRLAERAEFRVIDAARFKATWFWGLMILQAERPC